MGIETYSSTAGNNTTVGGVSVAENCPIANLNNADRAGMADIAVWYRDSQWVQYGDGDGAFTITYASATSFTVSGTDVTSTYHAGRRVRAQGSTTGTIYGAISSSSFSTNTTVNVTWASGSLSNESLTIWIGALSKTNDSIPEGVITAAKLASAAVTAAKVDRTAVNGQTALTAPATDDSLLLDDTSASALKTIVLSDLFKVINSFTEDTAPDTAADFVLSYDTSASGVKKVKPKNLAAPFAKYSYSVTSGTNGGGATVATTWTTLALNTEDNDLGSIGSLSSNQVTLAAGTYRVHGWCVFGVNTVATVGFGSRLRDVTNGATLVLGSRSVTGSTGNVPTMSFVDGEFTLSGSAAVEFQYYCSSTSASLGTALSSGENEVYRVLQFTKVG